MPGLMSRINQSLGLADPIPAKPEPIQVEIVEHQYRSLYATLTAMVDAYGCERVSEILKEITQRLERG